MADEYDVIVVGAGNGGMIAACTFAQMGLKTLVLEKHNLPGGCATSFVRGRFEFEASLHNLPYIGKGPQSGDVDMLYHRFGVNRKFYPIPDALHVIVDNDETHYEFRAGIGREVFAEELEKACPGSREAYGRFCALCDDLTRALGEMSRFRGRPDMEYMAKEHPNYLRLSAATVDEMFEAIEAPELMRDLMGVFALYQCGDTSKIDAARYCLMTDSFISNGVSQTDMRSAGLSTALVTSAKRYGADIWYDSEVVKICTDNGAVSGIMLKDGRKIRAKRVLCNIIPHIAYGKLLDPAVAPPMELKKTNARVIGARAFCVFLGMDVSYQELGIKDYAVFINSSMKSNECLALGKSRDTNCDMSLNCLNVMVPDASPEGTCILYITAMFTDDAFADVTPENYQKIKEDYAEKLIVRAEKALGVDLRNHIEEIVISTPVTYARYLGTPQGTVFGYASEDWDGMMSRNMGEGQERSIPGLYFAGGHGSRFNGYLSSYMSGFTTAMRIIGEMKGGAPG